MGSCQLLYTEFASVNPAKLLHRLRDKASAGEPRGTLSIAPASTRDKETSPRELETYLGTYKRTKGRKSVRVNRERRATERHAKS